MSRAIMKASTLDATIDVLDLRDAPVRQALEMTMQAGRSPWALDNTARGLITLKSAGQPIHSAVDAICSASTVPLTYKVENTIYLIRPSSPVTGLPARTPPFLPASQSAPTTTALTDVQRRVAGVMIMSGGPAYAILETGGLNGTNRDVRVVTFGTEQTRQRPAHLPSGITGVPDLTVTEIDTTGVTLSAADGTAIRVPLASAAAR